MFKSGLQKVEKNHIYPRVSKIRIIKGFVNKDNGTQGGFHWVCFILDVNKSFYFDSFDGQRDEFLLNQIPKPKISHKNKIQDINSRLFVSHCLYFFI